MTVIFRNRAIRNNLVENPPRLPYPMALGKVSVTLGLEQFPSASITYEGVLEKDLLKIDAAYPIKKRVSIEGISFIVKQVAYTRETHVYQKNLVLETYQFIVTLGSPDEEKLNSSVRVFDFIPQTAKKISVGKLASAAGVNYFGPSFDIPIPEGSNKDFTLSLSGILSEKSRVMGGFLSYTQGVDIRYLGGGIGGWQFLDEEVIEDGEHRLSLLPAYNEAKVTWNEEAEDAQNQPSDDAPGQQIELAIKEPEIETTIEEDENFEYPPSETFVLRTLDSNATHSGPIKQRTKTVTVNGAIQSQEIWTNGFEYTAQDIHVGNGLIFSSDPSAYWKTIEYQKKEYVYRKPPPLALDVRATDPDSPMGRKINLVAHPDYSEYFEFLGDGQFGTFVFKTGAQYLTEIQSSGYKRGAFEKETDKLETIALSETAATEPLDAALLKLYQFQSFPVEEKTAYLLQSLRATFPKEQLGLPFSVEWLNYDELPYRLKSTVNPANEVSFAGRVGVLIPDLDYAEPFFVVTETRRKSCFAWTPDPNSEPDNLLPPKVTGEEAYTCITRTVKNVRRYSEKTNEYSSQNSGFSDFVGDGKIREILGKPPDASTMIAKQWEKKEKNVPPPIGLPKPPKQEYEYFLSSDLRSNAPKGGSLSYSAAASQLEAARAARTELTIQGLQAQQSSVTIAWYHPKIKDGDSVSLERSFWRGGFIVLGVSWELEYKGNNESHTLNAKPIVLCQGTKLTLGRYRSRSASIRKEKIESRPQNATVKDPTLVVDAVGETNQLGEIIFNSPNRRMF
jgi:hypothetical protein